MARRAARGEGRPFYDVQHDVTVSAVRRYTQYGFNIAANRPRSGLSYAVAGLTCTSRSEPGERALSLSNGRESVAGPSLSLSLCLDNSTAATTSRLFVYLRDF